MELTLGSRRSYLYTLTTFIALRWRYNSRWRRQNGEKAGNSRIGRKISIFKWIYYRMYYVSCCKLFRLPKSSKFYSGVYGMIIGIYDYRLNLTNGWYGRCAVNICFYLILYIQLIVEQQLASIVIWAFVFEEIKSKGGKVVGQISGQTSLGG